MGISESEELAALRRVVAFSFSRAVLQVGREHKGLEPDESSAEEWLNSLDPAVWKHGARKKDEAAAIRNALSRNGVPFPPDAEPEEP